MLYTNCESEDGTATQVVSTFFPNDPLRDWQQCGNLECLCCTYLILRCYGLLNTEPVNQLLMIELRVFSSEEFIDRV